MDGNLLSLMDFNLACIICTVCEQPAVDGRSISPVTNKKVPCVLKLELTPLWLPMLHSALAAQDCPSPTEATYYVHEDVQF